MRGCFKFSKKYGENIEDFRLVLRKAKIEFTDNKAFESYFNFYSFVKLVDVISSLACKHDVLCTYKIRIGKDVIKNEEMISLSSFITDYASNCVSILLNSNNQVISSLIRFHFFGIKMQYKIKIRLILLSDKDDFDVVENDEVRDLKLLGTSRFKLLY
jgi:hypothetical protein